MNTEKFEYPVKADQEINIGDAYQAMFNFLWEFWERDGRPSDSIVKLLSWIQPVGESGRPADPAMWHDWIIAIKKAKAE